jgi:hypothetical protein
MRSTEDHKAGWGKISGGPQSLDLTDEELSRGGPRWLRADRQQHIGSEYRHELMDPVEKDLHIFSIRLRKSGSTRLPVHYLCSSNGSGLLDEPALKVADMRLRQVLVLADKEKHVIPKVSINVPPETVPNALGFPNIDRRPPACGIDSSEEIDARLRSFVSREHIIELAARTSNGLPRPVREFRGAQAFRVAMNQEKLDGCAGHWCIRLLPAVSREMAWPGLYDLCLGGDKADRRLHGHVSELPHPQAIRFYQAPNRDNPAISRLHAIRMH